MTVPFMDAYVKLLIKTCHRRGVHAMVRNPLERDDSRLVLTSLGWYGCPDPDQG